MWGEGEEVEFQLFRSRLSNNHPDQNAETDGDGLLKGAKLGGAGRDCLLSQYWLLITDIPTKITWDLCEKLGLQIGQKFSP